jgi:dTDP-glucose pyrophosphorylase
MTSARGTVAITMAGMGNRFTAAGYTQPKYEIEVLGSPLFDWSMSALSAFQAAGWLFQFATRSETGALSFLTRRCEALAIPMSEVLQLDALTDGQATTALLLAEKADPGAPFLVFNIDTYVRPEAMRPEQIPNGAAGWVPCFPGPGTCWSFARIDEANRALELREKKRISTHATVGLYWFQSAERYMSLYKEFFGRGGEELGERYIAPMYNKLIERQEAVYVSLLEFHDVGMLGTPEQVEAFSTNPPVTIIQKKLRE